MAGDSVTDLLAQPLPDLRLTLDIQATTFLDLCERIAEDRGWRVDRRRPRAGTKNDQLNLHLGNGPEGRPILRMIAVPAEEGRLRLDILDDWQTSPVEYDAYWSAAQKAYGKLLSEYKTRHGKRYRVSKPRRPTSIRPENVDCGKIAYAAEKFGGLTRSFAVGAGATRERLVHAYTAFLTIRPDDLPEPLKGHLKWVYDQVTRKQGRHRGEGSVEATVYAMNQATAARVIERLVDLEHAIARLDQKCDQRQGI